MPRPCSLLKFYEIKKQWEKLTTNITVYRGTGCCKKWCRKAFESKKIKWTFLSCRQSDKLDRNLTINVELLRSRLKQLLETHNTLICHAYYIPSAGSSRFARRPCLELLWTNMLSEMASSGPSTPTCVDITTCKKIKTNLLIVVSILLEIIKKIEVLSWIAY